MPRSSICPFKAKPDLRLRTQARGKLMEDPHYQLFTCLKLSFGTEKEMIAVVHCLRTWRHYLLRVFLISLLHSTLYGHVWSLKTLSSLMIERE